MTRLFDEPRVQTPSSSASERLRGTMAAARLSFNWLGVRKSLSSSQKDQAANSFGAEGKFLSAGKKLLDTSHPAFKAVTAIRGRTVAYWKGLSLPFPEPGIRLVPQDCLDEFNNQMGSFREELDEAVRELNDHYDELCQAARQRLGDLFDPGDYPPTLVGLFSIEHDFPSVEPPPYLRQLSPELYQQECRRVQSRFDEAVQMAEQAFTEELASLVDHLAERLSGAADGRPKVFRDSAVSNLTEFFERFRRLNVRSSEQLDELVANAQRIFDWEFLVISGRTARCNNSSHRRPEGTISRQWSIASGALRSPPHGSRKPQFVTAAAKVNWLTFCHTRGFGFFLALGNGFALNGSQPDAGVEHEANQGLVAVGEGRRPFWESHQLSSRAAARREKPPIMPRQPPSPKLPLHPTTRIPRGGGQAVAIPPPRTPGVGPGLA